MVRAGSPFTSIVSVMLRSGSQAPFHFTSFGFAGLSSSTNTSASSVPVAVRPHATCPLCPRITPGRPGSVAPTTFQPGAFRCTRYRHAGSVTWRCGSSTISGLPLAVNAPLDRPVVAAGRPLRRALSEGDARAWPCVVLGQQARPRKVFGQRAVERLDHLVGNDGDVEPVRHAKVAVGIGPRAAVGFRGAVLRHGLREAQLAAGAADRRRDAGAVEDLLGRPRLRA